MEKAFEGIKNLYSEQGFNKIQSSHFIVIGIGGVGSWICESLVRSGVTKLTIVDLDDICISNINRQIHALSNNIGKLKIDEMKSRLIAINPDIEVHGIYDFFSESTKDQVLDKNYDYVFDAIDSHKSKCLLLDECRKRKLPVICIGGTGGKADPTKIEIKDLSKSVRDNMLFWVRKTLRKHYGFSKFEGKPFRIPAVYSTEEANTPKQSDPKDKSKIKINCQSGIGSASFVTASFAFAAVSYVLKEITDETTN